MVGDAPDDTGTLLLRERTVATANAAGGAEAAQAAQAADADPDSRPADQTATTPGRGRRRRSRAIAAATGLLALAAGAAFGWTAGDAWGAGREHNDVNRGTAASATVVTMTGRFDPLGQSQLDALVRVVNLGTLPIGITGSQVAYLAAQTDTVSQVPLTMAPGETALVRLSGHLACSSPLPLGLPALTLRRADGLERALPVDGATAELTRICSSGAASGQSLQLVSAGQDGDRLRLVFDVPSGRTVRVIGISAGEVALTGRPLPGEVDGQPRAIWLDPPASCAVPWRTQGVPRALDVDLTGVADRSEVSGVGARVHLDVGYTLSSWLLDHACPGRT